MEDREVSATCVVAYGLWTLSLVLWVAAWGLKNEDVGRLSLIVCGAAITATVKTYFIGLGRRMKAAQAVTSIVEPSSVRPLR